MTDRQGPRVFLIAVLLLVTAGGVLLGDEPALDPSEVCWSVLEYKARKFGLSAQTTVSFEVVEVGDVVQDLIETELESPVAAKKDEVIRLSLDDRGLGKTTKTTILLDPGSAAAFQRVKVYSGKKGRYKAYRYGRDGIAVIRRESTKEQRKASPLQWEKTSEEVLSLQDWVDETVRITDPAALFYLVSASKLQSEGDTVRAIVFSNNKAVIIDLTVVGKKPLKVDYVEKAPRGKRRVKKKIDALRIAAVAWDHDSETKDAKLELLGLEGDVEMLVHPVHGFPLAVTGKAPVVGKITVRLQRVVTR